MSAGVESAPVRGSLPASIMIAIIVALGIGTAAGALVTKAVEDPAAVATTDGAASWDAQKLEAMQGRVLAAQVGAEDPPVKPHLPKRPPKA